MRKSQRAFLHFLLFSLLYFQSLIMADESEQPLISANEEDLEQPGGQDFLLLGNSRNTPPAKTEWPEVVGLAAEEAKKKIKEVMPEAIVQIVPPDHFVTMDFNTGRVRLYTDSAGLVAKPARIG